MMLPIQISAASFVSNLFLHHKQEVAGVVVGFALAATALTCLPARLGIPTAMGAPFIGMAVASNKRKQSASLVGVAVLMSGVATKTSYELFYNEKMGMLTAVGEKLNTECWTLGKEINIPLNGLSYPVKFDFIYEPPGEPVMLRDGASGRIASHRVRASVALTYKDFLTNRDKTRSFYIFSGDRPGNYEPDRYIKGFENSGQFTAPVYQDCTPK